MPSILVVDDDVRLATMVAAYLRDHQLDVAHAPDGEAALAELKARPFDLVILDLMLPDTNGLDLFRRLKAQPALQDLPVIMLTARGDPMDRVVGLEIGAEDYIPKPFEPRELLARIRVVLRRGRQAATADILRFGRLDIDRGSRLARLDGEEKSLTSYQFALLLAMAERAGRVLSRETLADLVRTDNAAAYDPSVDRSIDVHIARLRAAIEDDPKHPRRILTVRGVGYVFAKAQS
jgi:DNA-binding response OmpR family regulator